MKKIIIVCGVIAGIISSAWCAVGVRVFTNDVSLDTRTWLGYISMILSFSLIFVGVKSYRDKYNNGEIAFGKAFKTGLLITLVASTFYVIVWLISYYFFFPNFAEKYASLMLAQMKANGASQADINKEMIEMVKFSKWYKNPIFNVLITYSEIAPGGIVISLIAALILKKNSKPATVNI